MATDPDGVARAAFTRDYTDRAWRFDLTPQNVSEDHPFENDVPCHWSVLVYYQDKANAGLCYAAAVSTDQAALPFFNWSKFDDLGIINPAVVYANLVPIQGKLLEAYGRNLKVTVALRSDSESATVGVVVYQNMMFRPFTLPAELIQSTRHSAPGDFATHVSFLPIDGNVNPYSFEFQDAGGSPLLTLDLPLGNQSSQGVYFPIPALTRGIIETNDLNWFVSYRIFD